MCVQTKCIGCGKSMKSCALVNGKCYSCNSIKPSTPTPGPSQILTPPNITPDVYHTH